MKNTPLVSIIMPAFNAQKYIKESIDSVINQSYDNWELIVINDGSTDSTAEIVLNFKDERIALIEQENRGVSAARNRGLSVAKGEYITFLDADDILPESSLESRVDYLQNHKEVDLVDGRALVMDSALNEVLRVHTPTYKGELFPRLIKLDSAVYLTCFYMFKKEKLGNIRFKEGMSHLEDILFFIELAAEQNIQYGAVEETIFIYRVGHVSAMKNLDGLERGYIEFLNIVNKMDKITIWQKLYLHIKVSKILFLVWLKKKQFKKAFKSLFYIFNIIKE